MARKSEDKSTSVISINCVNCNGAVNLDLDNLFSFCPHCGSKLMLDIDNLNVIIKAKEETKQKEIHKEETIEREKEKTRQKELENETNIKIEKLKTKRERQKTWGESAPYCVLCFMLLAVLFGSWIAIANIGKEEKERAKTGIQIGFDYDDLDGIKADVFKAELEDFGFENIHLIPSNDSGGFFEFRTEGEIIDVTVDGNSYFHASDYYDEDDRINITYYTRNPISANDTTEDETTVTEHTRPH